MMLRNNFWINFLKRFWFIFLLKFYSSLLYLAVILFFYFFEKIFMKVSYTFYNVPEDKQESIKNLFHKNIDGKMDAYLKKIYTKHDAEVSIDYKIQQNKQGRYEAKFLFDCDGKCFTYNNKTSFKYVEDLINHAFKHFKENLSKLD